MEGEKCVNDQALDCICGYVTKISENREVVKHDQD